MSVTAATVVLGALVVLLIKTRSLRFSGALVCVVFGITLGLSPVGPASAQALSSLGSWVYGSLQDL